MALRLYSSASFDSTTGKTLVGVKEADERETVLFIATLDGDHTDASDAELIKLAVDWFTLKYVKDFSDQLLNDKINEVNRAAKSSQDAAEEAKAAVEQVKGMVRTVSLTLNETLSMLFKSGGDEEEQIDEGESEAEHEEAIQNN